MALPRAYRMSPVERSSNAQIIKVSPVMIQVDTSKPNQAAVVIPKKCVVLSTKRNRAKRQCTAILLKAFKKQQIGAIIVKVFRKPDSGKSIPDALGECLDKLGS